MKKVLSIILSIVLITSLFASCRQNEENQNNESNENNNISQEQNDNTDEENENESDKEKENNLDQAKKEKLKYSVLNVFQDAPLLGHDNPNDVVTPFIEDMWNISVSDVTFAGGMTPIERINMLVAADSVPDVVFVNNPNLTYFYETGAFLDLSDHMNYLSETDKYVTDAGWNRLKVDGKLVAMPASMSGGEIDLSNPELEEMVSNDPYYSPTVNWAFAVNESILKEAGYEFKTIKGLQAELDENPRAITTEDVAIKPELKTIEDFEEMLYRIAELDLKVDGKPIIPLSIPEWGAYHSSVLKAPTGGWHADPKTLEVTGFITNPNMKEFYEYWTKWYQDGVLDPDYLIHKSEQYQEKAAQGRIGIMLPAFDVKAVRENLKNMGSDLKVIPWPEDTKGHSVDPSYPGGWENIMFSKNLSEENIKRLLEYFDWFQTREAKEVFSWGPKSAGLYEDVDGEKKFVDEEFAQAYLNNEKTSDGKDAEYYGILNKNSGHTSKAGLCGPGILYNEEAAQRSYPLKIDAYQASYAYIATNMLNRDSTVLPAAGSASNEVEGYYWGTVKGTKIAPLLSTENDKEFDLVWEEILNDFKTNTPYEEAILEMTDSFKRALGK